MMKLAYCYWETLALFVLSLDLAVTLFWYRYAATCLILSCFPIVPEAHHHTSLTFPFFPDADSWVFPHHIPTTSLWHHIPVRLVGLGFFSPRDPGLCMQIDLHPHKDQLFKSDVSRKGSLYWAMQDFVTPFIPHNGNLSTLCLYNFESGI